MSGPTVLLIDGDTDSRTIYSLILLHNGFQVLEAADGAVGFELACQHRPDLIVLEPFVPLVEGRPVADLLHGDARTAGLRVLLVTAVPNLLDRPEHAGGHWSGCLIKPCQPRIFLAEVQRRIDFTPHAAWRRVKCEL